jgi:hypothetical protein
MTNQWQVNGLSDGAGRERGTPMGKRKGLTHAIPNMLHIFFSDVIRSANKKMIGAFNENINAAPYDDILK